MSQDILLSTDLKELKLFKRGKVRDVYDLGETLLVVSTDRISCFDVVLPCGISYKGIVLNKLSAFWFDFTKDILPNHFITSNIEEFPEIIKKYKDILRDRSMLVKKTKPIPVECIVRGYLSGSAWKEYKEKRSMSGIELPEGLKESEKLPKSLFTPATKEDSGHDINVDEEFVENLLSKKIAKQLKDISLSLYKRATDYSEKRGIIIADTKFEFGFLDDRILLIDELFTPDSSRFWPKDSYSPGRSQSSFDKQFVRDYLESTGWDKSPPAPQLPEDIIEKTSKKYLEVYKRLIGIDLI